MAYGMTPGHGAMSGAPTWDPGGWMLDATIRKALAERKIDKLVDRANHFDAKARWCARRGWTGREAYFLRQRDKFNAEAVVIKLSLAGVL